MKKIVTIRKNGTKRIQLETELASKTDQQFVEDADVNNIMANYSKTRNWPGIPSGSYIDLSEVTDLQGAVMAVRTASDLFMQVPATFREKFDNDPALFGEYISDPKNHDEAIEFGLLTPSPKQNVSGGTKSPDAVVPVPKPEPAAPAAPAKPDPKA